MKPSFFSRTAPACGGRSNELAAACQKGGWPALVGLSSTVVPKASGGLTVGGLAPQGIALPVLVGGIKGPAKPATKPDVDPVLIHQISALKKGGNFTRITLQERSQ